MFNWESPLLKSRKVTNTAGSCGIGNTALSWSQNGNSQPRVYDNNGQLLGNLVNTPDDDTISVYNSSLNRIVKLSQFNNIDNSQIVIGDTVGAQYTSSDCSGQPYLNDPQGIVTKTNLFTEKTSLYGIVSDSANEQTQLISSAELYDESSNTFSCDSFSASSTSVFPLTTAVLPFTSPVAIPLKF